MADAITLTDSQSTPVDHVFTPIKVEAERCEYANLAVTHGIGRESLILTFTEKGKTRRATCNLKDPRLITETINGVNVPSVPDYSWARVEFGVPLTHDQADTEDLVEMMRDLLGEADVVAMIAQGLSPSA